MTSPISLLAMLGGTGSDPAPAQPQAENAALFAAALVSALQQLQQPVKLAPAATPVPADGEVMTDQGSDEQAPAGGETVPATLGELLGSGKIGEAGVAADGADIAALSDAPPSPDPTDQATAPAAPSGDDTPPMMIDVTSDDPAWPADPLSETATHSTGKCGEADPHSRDGKPPVRRTGSMHREGEVRRAGRVIVGPSSREATVLSGQTMSTDPATPVEEPAADGCEAPLSKDTTGIETARAKTPRSAGKGSILVGDWSPPPAAFTGWKMPVERMQGRRRDDADRQTETTVDQASQVPSEPAVPPLTMLPPSLIAMPGQPIVSHEAGDDEAGDRVGSGASPAPKVAGAESDLESPNDAVRQAQVANARLAVQLAELVGDRNVTDFRVHLGKGKRTPQGSDMAPPDDAPEAIAAPAVKLPTEPALPAPDAGTKRPVVTHDAEPEESETKPQPPVAKAESPVRPANQTVTSNRLLDLSDGPRIAGPLRTARAAAGPIVPELRQEIPAPSQPDRKSAAIEPERPRARDTQPSDTPPAASAAGGSRSDSLTSRSDSAGPGESREARNLPQESSGNDRPAGSADRVTVQVSDSEGRQTRIRVSVLGDQVRAVIVPPDSESARQLEQRMDDLQTALARQGFASSKVSVQQAGEGAVERGGMSLAGMAGGTEGKAASPGREQPAGDQRQGRGQREQQQHPGDGHRHPNGRSRDQGAEQRRRYRNV